jgi:hypothetical protein
MERLQRAAETRARLLKAERLGSEMGGAVPGLLLTFEEGRLLIQIETASGEVHSVLLESRDGLAEELFDAGEAEPWWRVMGNPLTRVWPGNDQRGNAQGLRLQFRDDDDSPKVVALVPDGNAVRAFIDPKGRA